MYVDHSRGSSGVLVFWFYPARNIRVSRLLDTYEWVLRVICMTRLNYLFKLRFLNVSYKLLSRSNSPFSQSNCLVPLRQIYRYSCKSIFAVHDKYDFLCKKERLRISDGQTSSLSCSEDASNTLLRFSKESRYTEVTLKLDDVLFPWHHCFLASQSNFFNTTVLNGMRESRESVVRPIISDVSSPHLVPVP